MDWVKINKCKHKNTYSNYSASLSCECKATEYRCKDCGIYFNDCRCGEVVGVSGWSQKDG